MNTDKEQSKILDGLKFATDEQLAKAIMRCVCQLSDRDSVYLLWAAEDLLTIIRHIIREEMGT